MIQVLQLLATHAVCVSCQGQDVWQASLCWHLCGYRPPVHTCTETVKGTFDMLLYSGGPANYTWNKNESRLEEKQRLITKMIYWPRAVQLNSVSRCLIVMCCNLQILWKGLTSRKVTEKCLLVFVMLFLKQKKIISKHFCLGDFYRHENHHRVRKSWIHNDMFLLCIVLKGKKNVFKLL